MDDELCKICGEWEASDEDGVCSICYWDAIEELGGDREDNDDHNNQEDWHLTLPLVAAILNKRQ